MKALDRQVAEAINIKKVMEQKEVILMNAKTEYSRCILPGITPIASEEDKAQEDRVKKQIKDLKRAKTLLTQTVEPERPTRWTGAHLAPGNAQTQGAQESSPITQVSAILEELISSLMLPLPTCTTTVSADDILVDNGATGGDSQANEEQLAPNTVSERDTDQSQTV